MEVHDINIFLELHVDQGFVLIMRDIEFKHDLDWFL